MNLIGLLVLVIILGLIYFLVTQLPIAQPFKTVALVIMIIICILVLVNLLGFNLGSTRIHMRN